MVLFGKSQALRGSIAMIVDTAITNGNKKHREENDVHRRFPGHYGWINSYNGASLQITPSAWGVPFP